MDTSHQNILRVLDFSRFFFFVCFNLNGTEILRGELRAIIPQTE